MPVACQHHADVFEDRRDRRVRLMNGDLDGPDARKCRQDGVGYRAGRAFQQLVIGVLEGRGRGCNHVGIGHSIGEAIGVGSGLGQVVMLSRSTFNSSLTFFTMTIIGIVGYALDALLLRVQRRLLYWVPQDVG